MRAFKKKNDDMDMEVIGTTIEMGVKIENGVTWNEYICIWWIRER